MSERYLLNTTSFPCAIIDTAPENPPPDVAYEAAMLGGLVWMSIEKAWIEGESGWWWIRQAQQMVNKLNWLESHAIDIPTITDECPHPMGDC